MPRAEKSWVISIDSMLSSVGNSFNRTSPTIKKERLENNSKNRTIVNCPHSGMSLNKPLNFIYCISLLF